MVLSGIHPGKEQKLREGVMGQNHADVLVSMWLLEASCPLLSTSCPPPAPGHAHFVGEDLAREGRQGREAVSSAHIS